MTTNTSNQTIASASKTVSVSKIITCCIIAIFAATLLIAGGTIILALDAWLSALLMIPCLLVATMTGLAVTYFPARAAEKSGKILFAQSPWPAGFRLIVSLMLGLGVLSLITLIMGSTNLLYPGALALAYLPTTLLGVFGARQIRRQGISIPARHVSRAAWLLLLAALPLGVMLIMAAFPPGIVWASEGNGYDVLEYHLQLPREYLAAHSTDPVAHNIYSFMPSLMEMLYTAIGALASTHGGSFVRGIYACQYLHVLMTSLAGLAILFSPLKLNLVGRIAGCILILATPWTIVVGTLAYNDGAMLTFGILALILALTEDFPYRGKLIGILLGFAMGCKLTAGIMIAVPVGLILLTQFKIRPLIITIAFSALVFSPWAIRAYMPTGNPVYPVAMKTFGSAHLTPELRDQFNRGHAPRADQQSPGGRFSALVDQFFYDDQWSPNLYSLGKVFTGQGTAPTATHLGLIFPILGMVIILALRQRFAVALLLILILQFMLWMFTTHLQARFLLPVLLPLSLLAALACNQNPGRWLSSIAVAILVICSLILPYKNAALFAGAVDPNRPIPYFLGAASSQPEALALPDMYLDASDAGSLNPAGRCYLVGLSTPLFFTHPVIYNTPFDHNFLAESLSRGGPQEAIRMLRELNIQYVIISWPEIDRLRRTYGFPDSINHESMEQLTRLGLKQIPTRAASIEMYEVK